MAKYTPFPFSAHIQKGMIASMKHSNRVAFLVYGRYGLFTDPSTRIGGEKATYGLPTYQALKGITESIYWKPTITWFIDRVRIMHPIVTESKHMRPINFNTSGNTLSVYNYLREPCYQVEAHFEFNPYRPEFENDRNENKHFLIAKRMIERGGRRDIFLGTRECQGYVEPCVFGEGEGAYDNTGSIGFGIMLHGFDYPDETGEDLLGVRFWKPVMTDGVITFPKPCDCEKRLCRNIRPMNKKVFREFSGADEEALAKICEEVEEDELALGAERYL